MRGICSWIFIVVFLLTKAYDAEGRPCNFGDLVDATLGFTGCPPRPDGEEEEDEEDEDEDDEDEDEDEDEEDEDEEDEEEEFEEEEEDGEGGEE
ncbi:unnamed protein product [Rodentolepis nana]|uniref:Uncharacterized protein n=1 Tax=Rodentolepis nana TaxID=102285 RepID=A0A0R3TLQ1_RODNA|nr:unnamed protein product [Rodentolepis nana]